MGTLLLSGTVLKVLALFLGREGDVTKQVPDPKTKGTQHVTYRPGARLNVLANVILAAGGFNLVAPRLPLIRNIKWIR